MISATSVKSAGVAARIRNWLKACSAAAATGSWWDESKNQGVVKANLVLILFKENLLKYPKTLSNLYELRSSIKHLI